MAGHWQGGAPVASSGVRRFTPDHPLIPRHVRQAWPEAIPAIFVRGEWPVDAPVLAIVGTTEPTPLSRSWAFQLGREAARNGWVVVSGLARGIDGAAHEGALSGGGVTIAAVANGLDSVYPAEHGSLAERIVEQRGAIISIASPGTLATRERLLIRNQLTSGLSRAVISVQSRGRGGSLATMRHAVRQGRFIAACTIPPDAHADHWAGNTLLMGQEPPWRDRDLNWWPAMPVTIPGDIDAFFSALDALPAPVDDHHSLAATPMQTQPRLLDEQARYDVSVPPGSTGRRIHAVEGEQDAERRPG